MKKVSSTAVTALEAGSAAATAFCWSAPSAVVTTGPFWTSKANSGVSGVSLPSGIPRGPSPPPVNTKIAATRAATAAIPPMMKSGVLRGDD